MIIPQFPRTPHLPINTTSAEKDDIIAPDEAIDTILKSERVVIQEKLDGANLRIYFDGESNPVVGNREHILKKGYVKDTPAKLQFRPTWNWAYDNANSFKKLTKLLGETPVVFGEWMYARHTTSYDKLSTLFFAYDIYIDDNFLDPIICIDLLDKAGFIVPPHFHRGTKQELLSYLSLPSQYSSADLIEGLYFKIGDGKHTTERYKLLRPDYKRINNFTERGLIKNGKV